LLRIVVLGIVLMYICCTDLVFSQNLVKNPSFETYRHCPKRLGNFNDDVLFWSTPTLGSTDYFNGCSTTMGTPENFNGDQSADFGTGYAGFYAYAPKDYREYLQAELTQRLESGKTYRISFYVSLAERSDFAVKEFGVLFSKDSLGFTTKREISRGVRYKQRENRYHPLEIRNKDFFTNTKEWTLVQTDFVAKGWEKFLTLGNFKNNARTPLLKTKHSRKKGAYYYLDMVNVVSIEKMNKEGHWVSKDLVGLEAIQADTIHVFENVRFEFDRFRLLDREKTELRKIFQYLEEDANLKIYIYGHTDSVGSMAYNQELSIKRAKSVADYLILLGLPTDRILWEGYGGTRPISNNDTETGRSRNRRVEFKISKSK